MSKKGLAAAFRKATHQFAKKVIRAAPINADISPFGEVVLQITASALRFQNAAFLRLDLGGDVGVAVAPPPALLRENAAEQDAKIPLIHLKAQKEQRGIGQRPADSRGDEVLVAGHADQEVEVIVFGEHNRIGLVKLAKQVVNQRSLGGGKVV